MTLCASMPTQRPITTAPAVAIDIDRQDDRFLQLMTHLRPHGGMLPGEDVRSIGFVRRAGLSLGEALMRRDVFALTWRHRLWLPMFQFRMPSWALSPPVSSVARLMHPVVDGFDLAEWFVTPNPWLGGHIPLEAIENNAPLVMQAARAYRIRCES